MRVIAAIVFLATTLAMASPATAFAAETETYDLSFTLPTAGMSGCQVCHGDPNLVKVTGEATSSLFVDSEALADTAHPDQACTSCHTDFALKTPHENVDDDEAWKLVAQTSCQSCKDHSTQSDQYTAGAHTPVLEPGVTNAELEAERAAAGKPVQVPTCGGCHGGHAIPSKEDTAAQAAFNRTGDAVCGSCHADRSESYEDYYHGAAYREGAWDAPSCWDCHGAHLVLPASDRKSMVHPANLAQTCGGQEWCHTDVNQEFLEYAEFIHGRSEAVDENPLAAAFEAAKQGVSDAVEKIVSLFQS